VGFTARYISDGRYLDYIAPSDVAAGDVIVVGELVGVAVEPIPAGRMDGLCVEGLVDFAKAAGPGTGIAGGAKLYWDATNVVATTSDGGGTNKYIGKTDFSGAADGDATVRVRFHPL
jgi:predicted RecA/RadA family phage recombinase